MWSGQKCGAAGDEEHSQTIAINGSSDCMKCTGVSGLDALKRCNVPAVDVLERGSSKMGHDHGPSHQ